MAVTSNEGDEQSRKAKMHKETIDTRSAYARHNLEQVVVDYAEQHGEGYMTYTMHEYGVIRGSYFETLQEAVSAIDDEYGYL